VLRAFRDDVPFDRFLTDQLAGDLFPDATLAQKVATGFNRNHVTSDEGGAIIDELLVEYAVDRTATTGSVFLGLTVGCARCHDHKYDPVSQAEFYGLLAYFNSVEEPGLYSQTNDRTRAHEPFLAVPSPAAESELATLRRDLDAAKAALAEEPADDVSGFNTFLHETAATLGVEWRASRISRRPRAQARGRGPDGSVFFAASKEVSDIHTLTLDVGTGAVDALLVEILPDPPFPKGASVTRRTETRSFRRFESTRGEPPTVLRVQSRSRGHGPITRRTTATSTSRIFSTVRAKDGHSTATDVPDRASRSSSRRPVPSRFGRDARRRPALGIALRGACGGPRPPARGAFPDGRPRASCRSRRRRGWNRRPTRAKPVDPVRPRRSRRRRGLSRSPATAPTGSGVRPSATAT
jgi:hypothetical protein